MHVCAHTHTHTHTYAHICTHVHACTHTKTTTTTTQQQPHTHTYAHPHTHMHTHRDMHAHTVLLHTQQLHSDLMDFNTGVCHVKKSVIAECNPVKALLMQQTDVLLSPAVLAKRQLDANDDNSNNL